MLTLLVAFASAADPAPASPTRVVTQGTAVVHLELPSGYARWTDGTKTVTLQGPLVVDLFDQWAIVKNPTNNQIHVLSRDRVLYVGTNPPDSL
jgi:hypothetical protein